MIADLGISCSSERYKLGTSWAALMIIVSHYTIYEWGRSSDAIDFVGLSRGSSAVLFLCAT